MVFVLPDYKDGTDGEIQRWTQLKNSIRERYNPANKAKIARDKLFHWQQRRDVITYSQDFTRICQDIPGITQDEMMDKYRRGLKPHIRKPLALEDFEDIQSLMKAAERLDLSFHRDGTSRPGSSNSHPKGQSRPTPMDLGNIQLGKLTQEEREKCLRQGLCLRCRKPGHIAKNCPKGKIRGQ